MELIFMLKHLISFIIVLALLIPIIPQTEAVVYDTIGKPWYIYTLDFNDGREFPISAIVHDGTPVTYSPLVRAGYTFLGWKPNGGGDIFLHLYTPNIKHNDHFIAVWQNDETGEICPPDEPITPTGPTLVPSHNNPAAAYINLETETITLPFTAGAYSVNDGRSWKIGSLPELSKLLDRGMTLWAAQGYDKKAKRPTGTVVNFPKIERRPRGNTERLKPANQTDTWELRTRAGDLPTATYLWASTTDRKTASGAWQNWSGSQPLPASKQKVTILLRSPALAVAETTAAPARYVPAGRAFRVTAKGG
jgi:hypothetical protein